MAKEVRRAVWRLGDRGVQYYYVAACSREMKSLHRETLRQEKFGTEGAISAHLAGLEDFASFPRMLDRAKLLVLVNGERRFVRMTELAERPAGRIAL